MADFTPQLLPPVNASAMGGMMPFISPDQVAQNQTDMLQWQQRQALAQQLMGAQYQPNSGKVGLGGTILEKVMGALAQNQQNAKLSDILKQQFSIENQAAQAKRAQDLQDEYRKLQEEVYKGQQSEKAKRDYAPMQFQASGAFDPSTGTYTPSTAAASQEIGIKSAEAQAAAKAQAMYRAPPGEADTAKLGMINKIMGMPQSPQRDAMLASLVPPDAFASLTGGVTTRDKAAIDKRIPTLQDQIGKIDTALDIANSMKAQLASGAYPSSRIGGAIESYLPTQAQTSGAQQLTGDSNALLAAAQTALQSSGSRGSMLQLKVLGASKPNLANSPETNAHLIDTIVGTLNKARQNPAAELEHYGNGGTPTSWSKLSAQEAATRAPPSPAGTLAPLAGSGLGIPQPAIDHLKANPNLAQQFDEQFGQGSAASVLGQ